VHAGDAILMRMNAGGATDGSGRSTRR